jgi:Ti-type conjugative transfer relaxase TraA
MAIYHLTAKVISRARGQSIAAAAAYRSGSVLRDERYGLTHNYSRERRVLHSEIMSPPGTPPWAQHREILWNRVEAAERRKDAQLARAIDISLPVELSTAESVALVRDYIAQEFVARGMIADFSIGRTEPDNPHVHILLTLRQAAGSGFGPKMRQWNGKSNLFEWRAAWAERANQHLARAGHVVRIDHRTLEAQQSELVPSRTLGPPGRAGGGGRPLPSHLESRISEQRGIERANGDMILEDPTVALRALSRQRPTFTHEELMHFLKTRTDGPAQLGAALAAILASSELIALAPEGAAPARFTSRDLLEAEKSLMKRVAAMGMRRGHAAPVRPRNTASPALSEEQRGLLEYLAGAGDIKVLAASPDPGRGALLAAARELWESQGSTVVGVALSRNAVESLQTSTGIKSQTLASQEREWEEGTPPTQNHVVVIDGAEMIGLKQLERAAGVVDKARGMLVLLGDLKQLEAMGSTSPLRRILDKIERLTAPAGAR